MNNNDNLVKICNMEGETILVKVKNQKEDNKIVKACVWYRGLSKRGKLKLTTLCLSGACIVSSCFIAYQGLRINTLKNELKKKEQIINEELSKTSPVVKSENTNFIKQEPMVENLSYIEEIEPMIDIAVGNIDNHDAVRLTADVLRYSGISYAPASNGKDHPELSKSTKFQVLNDIEREYGRGPLTIFNPQDVSQISGSTIEEFEYVLPEALKEIAPALKDAEDTYGVNGFLIASIACLESSNGTSKLAENKNNLTGYNANDDYEGTSSFGSSFSSKSESILATAKLISEKYVDDKGMWHEGISIFDINKNYCSVTTWSGKNLNRIEKFESILSELK